MADSNKLRAQTPKLDHRGEPLKGRAVHDERHSLTADDHHAFEFRQNAFDPLFMSRVRRELAENGTGNLHLFDDHAIMRMAITGSHFSVRMPQTIETAPQIRALLSAQRSGPFSAEAIVPSQSLPMLSTMLQGQLRAAIRRDLERWEGFYEWMYLDSVGKVTVGYGTMLPDADAAAAIPFDHSKGGAATVAEIRAAFNTIASGSVTQANAPAEKKHGARYYQKITDLRMTIATAQRLRDHHVDNDYTALRSIYPHFDTFPDAAKVALFDMIYNLGEQGLRDFRIMNTAIAGGDWAKAARESHRDGPPPERNVATAALFRSCVVPNTRP